MTDPPLTSSSDRHVQSEQQLKTNLTGARSGRIGKSVLATFVAALGPLSFGYCLGYSSSALEDLKDAPPSVNLNAQQGSWFSVCYNC